MIVKSYKFLVGSLRVTINFYVQSHDFELYRLEMLEESTSFSRNHITPPVHVQKLLYTRMKLQISAQMATHGHQSSRESERLQILRSSKRLAVSKNSCNSIRRSVQLREITNPLVMDTTPSLLSFDYRYTS